MYERLFATDAAARALFPVDMAPQRQKLLHMLGLTLSAMSEPERLAPALEDLGRRHLHYAVEPRHFRALEDALLGSLAEHDPSWSEDIARGWRRSFGFIETSMTRGMESERGTLLTEDSRTIARWPRVPASPPNVRTRYANNDDASLAYQVFGEGPVDILVLLGSISHVELNWREPRLSAFLVRLSQLGRVVVFDKRGTGLSDRAFEAASIEERVADVSTVIKDSEISRPVVIGLGEGAATATLFGAIHPEAARGLVLYGATPLPEDGAMIDARAKVIREQWGEAMLVDLEAPSLASDKEFCSFLALYMRMASSPTSAIKMLRANGALDLRWALASIVVPTRVIHRTGDRVAPIEGARHMAAHIAGAELVELPGDDHLAYVRDDVIAAIESFTPLRSARPAPH